jgi:hypothetical protein
LRPTGYLTQPSFLLRAAFQIRVVVLLIVGDETKRLAETKEIAVAGEPLFSLDALNVAQAPGAPGAQAMRS